MDKKDKLRVRNTPPFKLKDRNKSFQAINLMKQFGFLPEVIIVEKVQGNNNTIFLRAFLTEAEIKKEDNLKATMIKKKGKPLDSQ